MRRQGFEYVPFVRPSNSPNVTVGPDLNSSFLRKYGYWIAEGMQQNIATVSLKNPNDAVVSKLDATEVPRFDQNEALNEITAS